MPSKTIPYRVHTLHPYTAAMCPVLVLCSAACWCGYLGMCVCTHELLPCTCSSNAPNDRPAASPGQSTRSTDRPKKVSYCY
jgi:hypothetical protein